MALSSSLHSSAAADRGVTDNGPTEASAASTIANIDNRPLKTRRGAENLAPCMPHSIRQARDLRALACKCCEWNLNETRFLLVRFTPPPLAVRPACVLFSALHQGVGTMSGRIVVVEDERLTRAILIEALQQAGFSVRGAADAGACRAALQSEPADLIVLDLGLPGQDGQAYARELRAESDVPVLIVTSRSSAEIDSLNDGADGFLRKPIEPNVLVAHVNALLRRRAGSTDSHFRFGAWRIDLEGRILRNPDGEIESLTRGEFKLLALLVQAQGRIVSRELLSEAANRGHRHGDEFGDLRSVDALVSRLRRKLGSDIIGTAPGFGYRLAAKVERA